MASVRLQQTYSASSLASTETRDRSRVYHVTCSRANSASYSQRDGEWVPPRAVAVIFGWEGNRRSGVMRYRLQGMFTCSKVHAALWVLRILPFILHR